MRRARGLVSAHEGQAVVEFALALPLLLIVLMGLVQLGLVVHAKTELEGVAHQAARAYALSEDMKRTVDVLRLVGEPLARFGERTHVSIVVSEDRERIVEERTPRTQCRRVSGGGFRGPVRNVCETVYDVVRRTERFEDRCAEVSGRVSDITVRPAERPSTEGKRCAWVTVTATYAFPNPIRTSIGGFQLPAVFDLTTRATARTDVQSAEGTGNGRGRRVGD